MAEVKQNQNWQMLNDVLQMLIENMLKCREFWNCAEVYKSWRSRKILKQIGVYMGLLAKIGFDTNENKPS